MTKLKLQGVYDGRLYASRGRTVYEEVDGPSLRFERRGQLPVPTSGFDGMISRAQTSGPWKRAIERVVGAFQTTNVWRFADDMAIATAGRWLFRSVNGYDSWEPVHQLPESSSPMGLLPSGCCFHDGTIYLGEYPLDSSATPRVLASTDGETWEPLLSLPDVRHVHAVQVDPYTGELWLTTGDTDEESRIYRLRDGELEVVGGGSQCWRAVELAFTPDTVLWGMDCVYAPEKHVFALDRESIGTDDLSPTSVHTVGDSVYYSASFVVEGTQWIAFATAAEAGADSTGPGNQRIGAGRASVIASSAASGFTEWHTLVSYDRRLAPTDRVNPGGRLPVANAYVLLVADPDRGLFVNPYNTSSSDRTIRLLPNTWFESVDRDVPFAPSADSAIDGNRR